VVDAVAPLVLVELSAADVLSAALELAAGRWLATAETAVSLACTDGPGKAPVVAASATPPVVAKPAAPRSRAFTGIVASMRFLRWVVVRLHPQLHNRSDCYSPPPNSH